MPDVPATDVNRVRQLIDRTAERVVREVADRRPAPRATYRLQFHAGFPFADAAAIAQRDTRRYAKRQFTWMAGQMEGWPNAPSAELEARMKQALSLLDAQK